MTKRITLLALVLALTTGLAAYADEYEGKVEGPYMSIEIIEVEPYGGPAYLEYLGKGYIPILEAAKGAGHVLDYGILQYQTGRAGDGNLVIWWAAESMAAMQAAGELMEKTAGELRTPAEWKEMTDAIAKVRTPLSTDIARAVVWTKKEAAAESGDEE